MNNVNSDLEQIEQPVTHNIILSRSGQLKVSNQVPVRTSHESDFFTRKKSSRRNPPKIAGKSRSPEPATYQLYYLKPGASKSRDENTTKVSSNAG